jgi:peptidyl-prolyl cis-trans isomerase C
MRYALYALLSTGLFALGAYVWKAKHNGLLAVDGPVSSRSDDAASTSSDHLQGPPAVVVEIGGEKINKDDIDWEYELLMEGVFDKETMTPIPDLGARYHEEMQSLRKTIIANVVERKVLYAFAKLDKDFDATDPARFSACLSEWREALDAGSRMFHSRENKARLKSRLCERAILQQYVKERVFSRVDVSDAEIVEYYKNHASEYRMPERVVLRQVLLPDEPTAKRVRNQVNQGNFEVVARAQSIAPEAAQGGRLGPFAKGGMPSVFDVAFHMKRGEISPILKSPYGYHVIMLVERLPGTQASLDAVRHSIRSLLRKKREAEEYQKLVERALAAVNVSTPAPLW